MGKTASQTAFFIQNKRLQRSRAWTALQGQVPRISTSTVSPAECQSVADDVNSSETAAETEILDDVSIPLSHLPVGGRLKYFYKEWAALTSDIEVLHMIRGMEIDFDGVPQQTKLPHEMVFNRHEMDAAKQHIVTLLQKKAIQETSFDSNSDFLGNIFLRPKHDGGYRMILNLKEFNKYVKYIHFKMESFQQILDLIVPGCYMAVLDLTDAYLTVPVSPKY